jgi:SAM-dependent methyltransferase
MADPRAPDGSWVEVYRLLPGRGEAELVHAAIPSGAVVLELGCGAGRITRGLVALGHPVVAVDESPEMLALVSDAETVLSSIEVLDLRREFPAVLLASNLVNTPNLGQRGRFLATCRRHLASGGSVLIERMDTAWANPVGRLAAGIASVWGPVRFTVTKARLDGRVLEATVDYDIGGEHRSHSFRSEILDDEALDVALEEQGLVLRRWVDRRRRWAEAKGTAAR